MIGGQDPYENAKRVLGARGPWMILTNGQVQPTSSFVPKSLVPALPPLLLELYNSRFVSASYSELQTLVNVSITPAQRTAVEEYTRD